MRCLAYALIGAVAMPALTAVIMLAFLAPMYVADHYLGVEPWWGFLATIVMFGSAAGGIICWKESR